MIINFDEKCYRCGENARSVNRIKLVQTEDGSFKPVCKSCLHGPVLNGVPAYNQRPLGFPKVHGGKVAPGRYEWHD